MAIVTAFQFNPFQENTYILHDETKECIIIDPGCFTGNERKMLTDFIKKNDLKPVRLINTHCHLDHVFGVNFVSETYNLPFETHKLEESVLARFPHACQMFGIPSVDPIKNIDKFVDEGDVISFGNTELSIIFTPGHSPGSISFYNKKDAFLISGDVLFLGSIGRTDLPGAHHQTLIDSITDKLMLLPDETKVYSGHGSATTIGRERRSNPFLIG